MRQGIRGRRRRDRRASAAQPPATANHIGAGAGDGVERKPVAHAVAVCQGLDPRRVEICVGRADRPAVRQIPQRFHYRNPALRQHAAGDLDGCGAIRVATARQQQKLRALGGPERQAQSAQRRIHCGGRVADVQQQAGCVGNFGARRRNRRLYRNWRLHIVVALYQLRRRCHQLGNAGVNQYRTLSGQLHDNLTQTRAKTPLPFRVALIRDRHRGGKQIRDRHSGIRRARRQGQQKHGKDWVNPADFHDNILSARECLAVVQCTRNPRRPAAP